MNKYIGLKAIFVSASLAFAGIAAAGTGANCDNDPFDIFTNASNGWTQIADNDGDTNPGTGGQDFDAEYLFYKYDATSNNLSIGLQSGFDLVDGKVTYGSYYNRKNYYAGDLALSFDGDTNGANGSGYEYAVDFGLLTKTLSGQKVSADGDGTDTKGLYQVSSWNNDISYSSSSPFAMDGGDLIEGALISDSVGSGTTGNSTGWCGQNVQCTSFYRVVTFNLNDVLVGAGDFTVDAHWTMSCGNDNINGTAVIARNDTSAVPEPSMLALFGLGSLSLVASGYRRRKLQK